MPNPKEVLQHHAGFEITLPASGRMLISPVHLMPAHKRGEDVSPYPGIWQALWDTGAQSSTISIALAEQLKLPVVSERVMIGAGGKYRANEYLAGLLLPNDVVVGEISLFGFIGSAYFDLLIGMDIITLGDFLVSTHAGMMQFSFQIPSMGGIKLASIRSAVCADGRVATTDQIFSRNGPKIGRNERCPCGSGKKYKSCHGRERLP
jgi:hypothetical protein